MSDTIKKISAEEMLINLGYEKSKMFNNDFIKPCHCEIIFDDEKNRVTIRCGDVRLTKEDIIAICTRFIENDSKLLSKLDERYKIAYLEEENIILKSELEMAREDINRLKNIHTQNNDNIATLNAIRSTGPALDRDQKDFDEWCNDIEKALKELENLKVKYCDLVEKNKRKTK